jgi:hypothetical protein
VKAGDLYLVGRGSKTHVIRKVYFTGQHDTGCDWSGGETLCGLGAYTNMEPRSQLFCSTGHRMKAAEGAPSCKTCQRLEKSLG